MTQVMWSVLLLQMVYYHETEGAQGGKGSKQKAPRSGKERRGATKSAEKRLVPVHDWIPGATNGCTVG